MKTTRCRHTGTSEAPHDQITAAPRPSYIINSRPVNRLRFAEFGHTVDEQTCRAAAKWRSASHANTCISASLGNVVRSFGSLFVPAKSFFYNGSSQHAHVYCSSGLFLPLVLPFMSPVFRAVKLSPELRMRSSGLLRSE